MIIFWIDWIVERYFQGEVSIKWLSWLDLETLDGALTLLPIESMCDAIRPVLIFVNKEKWQANIAGGLIHIMPPLLAVAAPILVHCEVLWLIVLLHASLVFCLWGRASMKGLFIFIVNIVDWTTILSFNSFFLLLQGLGDWYPYGLTANNWQLTIKASNWSEKEAKTIWIWNWSLRCKSIGLSLEFKLLILSMCSLMPLPPPWYLFVTICLIS